MKRHPRVELRKPVTITLAPPEIRHWGPYQFPGPDGTPRKAIRVRRVVTRRKDNVKKVGI
ncbi:MAG: hypothetical protein ACOYOU_11990 [Kiritimatiellia bacterium]